MANPFDHVAVITIIFELGQITEIATFLSDWLALIDSGENQWHSNVFASLLIFAN
jgi:hypothetical protein